MYLLLIGLAVSDLLIVQKIGLRKPPISCIACYVAAMDITSDQIYLINFTCTVIRKSLIKSLP